MIRRARILLAESRFQRTVKALYEHGKGHCGGTDPCPYWEGLSQRMSTAHDDLLRLSA